MSETTLQEETPAVEADPRPALGAHGLLLLGVAALAAGGFVFLHDPLRAAHPAGIGLTATQWILLAAALWSAKRQGRLNVQGRKTGVFLLILALLLGGTYAVFANGSLRLMNLPVTVLLSAQAVFSLTGQSSFPPLSAQGLWEGLRRFFPHLFLYWDVPFRALAQGRKSGRGYPVFLGLILALPAAGVALLLLSSADEVFGRLVQDGLQRASRFDGSFVLQLRFFFLLAMALFSALFSAARPGREIQRAAGGSPPPAVFAVILTVLALVYGLFAYVQIRYLFAGMDSVRMTGGYAAYARRGFFQLVLLAFLTLSLILPALTVCRESRAVRALCAAVSALTGVIDASAFFRMRLYIAAYGLSTLRVLTEWAMAMILLALLAVILKSVFPALRVCPFLAAAVLTSWVALNYANVDRITAASQVERINAGEAGFEAISSLPWSPDYYPAAEKIQDAQLRERALSYLAHPSDGSRLCAPGAYEWSLSFLRIPGDEIH